MKKSYLILFLSFLLFACDKEETNTTDDSGSTPNTSTPVTNTDRADYIEPETDYNGDIVVSLTPADYVEQIESGQHMLPVGIPQEYYSSASTLSGDELKTALATIISADAIQLAYTSSSANDVWDMCEAGDENPESSSEVWLIYTEESIAKTAHVSGSTGWNREHVWAKSHGSFGTDPGPGTDGHHLRASDATENSNRGNLDFAYVNGARTKDGSYYEPPLSAKGDVARAIFYMALRYDFVVDNSAGTGARMGKLDDLLEWNELDPVDPYEIRRNNIIYEYQNNRNPFIDHPEFVTQIWGN